MSKDKNWKRRPEEKPKPRKTHLNKRDAIEASLSTANLEEEYAEVYHKPRGGRK